MHISNEHTVSWPLVDSTVEPDARQAVIWALLGLIIPVIPSVMALYVMRRAAAGLRAGSGQLGLAHCRVAAVLGVVGIVWGIVGIAALLTTA